jgi:hypothetical protein
MTAHLLPPLVAYRGLWDRFDGPDTLGAFRRALRRGVSSLVHLRPGGIEMRDALTLAFDPSINIAGLPLYLVFEAGVTPGLLGMLGPCRPAVYAIARRTPADLWPMRTWDDGAWRMAGWYAPVACLHACPPLPASRASQLLVESLDVLGVDGRPAAQLSEAEHERRARLLAASLGATLAGHVSDLAEAAQLRRLQGAA